MQNDKPATMQIRCKFGSLGELERQFHSPHGFCMGPNEEIIVADTFNHRIQVIFMCGNTNQGRVRVVQGVQLHHRFFVYCSN